MEPNTNSYKVVVVDDETTAVKAICRVIEKTLSENLKSSELQRNGKEALEIISENASGFGADRCGHAADKWIGAGSKNQGERMPDLCFVIISGYQDFEHVRDAFCGGVLNYLTKPIVPSQMLGTMKNVEEKLKQKYYDKQISICANSVSERRLRWKR